MGLWDAGIPAVGAAISDAVVRALSKILEKLLQRNEFLLIQFTILKQST